MRNNRKTDTIIYSILLCTSMKTSIRNIYICVSKKKKTSIVMRLFTSVKLDAVLDDGVMMVGFVVVVVVVFFSFFLAKRW